MTPFHKIIKVDHMDKLQNCINHMANHHINSLLVLREGEIMGLITSQDILRIIAKEKAAALALPVGSITTRDLITIKASSPLNLAIEKMDQIQTHHILVTDNEEIVGLVSSLDIVREKALDYKAHPWIRN